MLLGGEAEVEAILNTLFGWMEEERSRRGPLLGNIDLFTGMGGGVDTWVPIEAGLVLLARETEDEDILNTGILKIQF